MNGIVAAADALVFKGTIGTNGTVTALPNTHSVGWTYKVITAGTYAGQVCEVGDMIICVADGTAANNAHWSVIQNNIETAAKDKLGVVKTTSSVTSTSGLTAAPIINGVVYYKDTNTDTHYTSKNVVGSSSATANTTTALTNGNVYLNSVENGSVTSSHKISGSGATEVITDTSGNIIVKTEKIVTTSASGLMSAADKTKLNGIATGATAVTESIVSGWGFTKNGGTLTSIASSAATTGTPSTNVVVGISVSESTITPQKATIPNMTAATSTAAGAAGLVPAPGAGAQVKFLRGDGTWQTVLTSLATATTSAKGGVIVGDGININNGTISVASISSTDIASICVM